MHGKIPRRHTQNAHPDRSASKRAFFSRDFPTDHGGSGWTGSRCPNGTIGEIPLLPFHTNNTHLSSALGRNTQPDTGSGTKMIEDSSYASGSGRGGSLIRAAGDECLLDVDPGQDLGDELVHLPGIRVLVADLDRVIADTLAMILNASGFSAFPAYNVDHAVRTASESAIDVAFIELLIGETNAIDAAMRVLAVRPYCRIIIWTGRSEPVLSWVRREAEEQLGGCALICKPVHPADVIRIARGEPIPHECAIPSGSRNAIEAPASEEDYLRGERLYEYLSQARDMVLRLMGERR